MKTLHTFGCSITQGFALPDTIRPATDEQGRHLTPTEIIDRGIPWNEIHLYQPSRLAWPQRLADRLGVAVENHARRGACFQQIARQVAVAEDRIDSTDLVIVMWTYMSRLSLQWPARTAVPFNNIADPNWGWKSVILGFNRFFGLEQIKNPDRSEDQQIQDYIETSSKRTYLDPLGIYNRYYNNLVLQTMTAGLLESRGCRVIHLSVEVDPVIRQLEEARRQLPSSLQNYSMTPDPRDWYRLEVDYGCVPTLMDPRIPPAENDTHPSETHHDNFAEELQQRYFV
jgi:hypothetical protein